MFFERTISSKILVRTTATIVWENIIQVKLDSFNEPWYFKLLGIPKPLSAEVTKNGKGGHRVAYFENNSRFTQQITAWDKNEHYAFTFEPSDNFKAGLIFDLKTGPFRMLAGAYYLKPMENGTELTLETTYAIAKNKSWFLSLPVKGVLKLFQRYLLKGIKKNAKKDVS